MRSITDYACGRGVWPDARLMLSRVELRYLRSVRDRNVVSDKRGMGQSDDEWMNGSPVLEREGSYAAKRVTLHTDCYYTPGLQTSCVDEISASTLCMLVSLSMVYVR